MADVGSILSTSLGDRYAIERELGRGGMASVWLAHDLRYGRDVAVKILKPELAAALGTDRFLREVEIVARLHHPHILALFDSGEIPDLYGPGVAAPYFVMPFVAGETLRHRLRREGALPLDDALAIARDIADALGYAHAQGVVHRDVKPENILLDRGHAVVADFGVARAVDRAGGDTLSSPGLAVGTPTYMSPEQSAGGNIDGRSDVYALGCVLYEMLAGEPPFGGATPQVVAARHLHDAPPALQTVRPALPPWVTTIVERALAKMPADRFQSASAFATALSSPTVTTELPAALARSRWRRLWWLVLLAAILAIAALVALALRGRRPAAVSAADASRYVVLPFRHVGRAAPALLNGDQCESLIYDAFARWSDVRLVNTLRVGDAVAQHGAPATLEASLALARQLGAEFLVWGQVSELQDTMRVGAAVYMVQGDGRMLREASLRMPVSESRLAARFGALADSLLLGAAPRGGAAAALGTSSLAAWRAYESGDSALARWNTALARDRLTRALAADPAYPQANLRLAQLLAWRGEPSGRWEPYAARALADSARLRADERLAAGALLAFARGDYPGACDRYRDMLARDSSSFVAWFGLGECQGRDTVVLADPRSPSGWRFRGSAQAAVTAYHRAFALLPSVHAAFAAPEYSRLTGMFITQPNAYRLGFGSDGARFAAFPALENDSLAFTPYPEAWVLEGRRVALPLTVRAAVSRGRELLRDITSGWVASFPDSPDALEVQALALEQDAEFEPPALSDARVGVWRARRLAVDPAQRLRLAVAEARLALKLGDWTRAAQLADSLLDGAAARARGAPAVAGMLAPLAALSGRARLAAMLLAAAAADPAVPAAERSRIPLPLAVAGARLAGFAAAGGPGDSIRAAERQLRRLAEVMLSPGARAAAVHQLADQPRALAFPALAPEGKGYLLALERTVARGGATLRDSLRALDALRRERPTGAVTIDAAFAEARLRAMAGDSVAAAAELDAVLGAPAALGVDLLDQPAQAGALVRAMALRGALAARRGEGDLARRWGGAVRVLRRNADPDLES